VRLLASGWKPRHAGLFFKFGNFVADLRKLQRCHGGAQVGDAARCRPTVVLSEYVAAPL
jgi:hypothetical protein